MLSDLPVPKVTRALESVGFSYVRAKGKPRGIPEPGRARGRCPHHAVVKRDRLAPVLRQAGLTPAEFLKFLD